MIFEPRPKQKQILEYTGGKMGVAAVPGSGKTQTLSYLAARLVAEANLTDEQEILIVTLVNSAVDNFAQRVGAFVQERGLLPNFGYRVRTLHGLCNDIVRERPRLAGLSDDFHIIDERESQAILDDAVNNWVKANPRAGEQYLDPDMDENKAEYILRDQWPAEVAQIANNFIKQAKDFELTSDDVRYGLERYHDDLPLAEMCYQIYVSYERSLSYRGGIDFQDLIRLALQTLQDDGYLNRLKARWPYILEDEAQDSSLLQEKILSLLAGDDGNWVRVGDPNQAIYETFTTAKPEYLRNFLNREDVLSCELPNSGRSTHGIINLANYLVDWVAQKHPDERIRATPPLQPPKIEPTPHGDPQPNPNDIPGGITIVSDDLQSEQELTFVAEHICDWLPHNQDKTVAVLVPRNDRGAQVVRLLKQYNIEVVELLRSTSTTRETAGALYYILDALSRPNAAGSLAMAYKVWRRDERDNPNAKVRMDNVLKIMKKITQVEDYLWPASDADWINSEDVTALLSEDNLIEGNLLEFREYMRRWQAAVTLPIDQMILTIAQDLFYTTSDLAIAHALSVTLRRDGEVNPHYRLPDFVEELGRIAQNRRRVADLSDDATGFDPDKHKGKATIATIHRAKGLEWDRVYLMSINNYDFPSNQPQDTFISEKWFLRDHLNLQAEALEQLKVLSDPLPHPYEEGLATIDARLDYVSERLRLLYVGITRARQEIILTCNTGRRGTTQQAVPFIGLDTYLRSELV